MFLGLQTTGWLLRLGLVLLTPANGTPAQTGSAATVTSPDGKVRVKQYAPEIGPIPGGRNGWQPAEFDRKGLASQGQISMLQPEIAAMAEGLPNRLAPLLSHSGKHL